MRLIGLTLATATLQLIYAARPYSEWMSDSFIRRGVGLSNGYTQATLYYGIEKTFNSTQNATYYDFLVSQIDGILTNSSTIEKYKPSAFSLDDVRIGTIILYLYRATGNKKYKTAADQIRSQLNSQPRTASGGFWHRSPKYPNQMWLDGLYMAEPFYAQYTALFEPGNTTAWDDMILQFDLIEKHCRNTTSDLLVHGYDESKKAVWADAESGGSPHVWDRAVGWYFMALVDILDWFPLSHPGRARLIRYFTTLAAALEKVQDSSGGWWLVMDEPYPGMKGNYIESSGTAMFTYGFLKGVRLGYISDAVFLAPAKKAYQLMIDKFVARNGTGGTLNWEGTVLVGSLDQDASFKVTNQCHRTPIFC